MQRRKLLILENDRELRAELEKIFADLEVTFCDTSEQALVLLRRIEPDVVLFDLGTAQRPEVARHCRRSTFRRWPGATQSSSSRTRRARCSS